MLRKCLLLIMFLGVLPLEWVLLGQGMPSPEVRASLEAAVDQRVGDIVSGPVLQRARATYLEEYGVVVTVEVALERPRNPFSAGRDREPAEVRRSSEASRSALKEMAVALLRQHIPNWDGLGTDERMTIVIYMLNTNPVDLPDLPTQLQVSTRKQDVIDLPAASAAAFANRVTIREY